MQKTLFVEVEANQRNQHVHNPEPYHGNYRERRLIEMREEAELYRQQLELEHLRYELNSLRGHPSKPILPLIGTQQYPQQAPHAMVSNIFNYNSFHCLTQFYSNSADSMKSFPLWKCYL